MVRAAKGIMGQLNAFVVISCHCTILPSGTTHGPGPRKCEMRCGHKRGRFSLLLSPQPHLVSTIWPGRWSRHARASGYSNEEIARRRQQEDLGFRPTRFERHLAPSGPTQRRRLWPRRALSIHETSLRIEPWQVFLSPMPSNALLRLPSTGQFNRPRIRHPKTHSLPKHDVTIVGKAGAQLRSGFSATWSGCPLERMTVPISWRLIPSARIR